MQIYMCVYIYIYIKQRQFHSPIYELSFITLYKEDGNCSNMDCVSPHQNCCPKKFMKYSD